tara:strand:+ start:863 stop:1105 length:243 start_codon:yes stop_codon:yes gene_type:complete
MNLTKGIKEMTIDDLNDNLDPNEPTDEELAEIELELEDDPFTISEEEYEESFGGMVDLDKGLFGANHREKLSTIRKVYNS